MNKKLLALLVAGLVLVSAVACTENPDNPETLPPPESGESESYIVIGTDESGNDVTTPVVPETDKPIEVNPTFADKTLKVVVIANRGTIRNAPDLSEESKVAWPAEGTELNVTGESVDWYRISYGENTCYITKAIVADAAGLEGFTAVENETVTVVGDVNVRSYPSADSDYSIRGSLKSGTTATRVAVGETWSKILFTVKVEVETGDPVEVQKEYYIHNNYIKVAETDTGAAESETVASTEADVKA